MGIWKRRFINSALKTLTNVIYTILKYSKKYIASFILLNILGVFLNISYPRLLYNLKIKGILA